MKFKTLLISCLTTLILAPSCIKEEGLDREADILSITIEDKGFVTSVVNDNTREISIIMEGDISKYENGVIVPEIKTSSRSTVSPKSFEAVKLNNYSQSYIVTAEDGGQKTYELTVSTYKPLIQDFEYWNDVNSGSNKPYSEPADPLWACGNGGMAFVYPVNTLFPTRKIEDSRPGSDGQYSVLLETTQGNKSGVDVMNIPVFSGNMFRGAFKIDMTNPLLSTKFGQPHPAYLGKPIALTAWFKYKSGSPYVSWTREYKGGPKIISKDPNKKDTFDMYAILYKVIDKDFYLTGENINQTEHKAVVAYTKIENEQGEKDEWTEYKTNFIYKEELDFKKNTYRLAVILASSSEGANYMGAEGSTLIVDDLRVVFETDKDAAEYK